MPPDDTARRRAVRQFRELQKADRAIRRFRPGKKDRGRYVPVNKEGKRLRAGSKAKGILVWVTAGGNKRIVTDRRGDITFHSLRSLSPYDDRFRRERGKQAYEKRYYAGRVRAGKGKSRSADWQRLSKRIAKDILKELKTGLRGRQYIITVEVTFRVGRKRFTVTAQSEFKRASMQRMGIRMTERYAFSVLWSLLAQHLRSQGYVSSGSTAAVRGLRENRGKPKREWVTAGGDLWGKSHLQIAHLEKAEWVIEQLVVGGQQ